VSDVNTAAYWQMQSRLKDKRIDELEAENQRLRLTLHTIMEGTGDTRGMNLGVLIGRIYDHAREALDKP
jgi:hypothetical protein